MVMVRRGCVVIIRLKSIFFGITKVNGDGSCNSKGLRDFLKSVRKVKSLILVLNEGGVVIESEVFD